MCERGYGRNAINVTPDMQAVESCADVHGQREDAWPHPLWAGES
jgi:hypothetical protein